MHIFVCKNTFRTLNAGEPVDQHVAYESTNTLIHSCDDKSIPNSPGI